MLCIRRHCCLYGKSFVGTQFVKYDKSAPKLVSCTKKTKAVARDSSDISLESSLEFHLPDSVFPISELVKTLMKGIDTPDEVDVNDMFLSESQIEMMNKINKAINNGFNDTKHDDDDVSK